jgi:hypothetical protein
MNISMELIQVFGLGRYKGVGSLVSRRDAFTAQGYQGSVRCLAGESLPILSLLAWSRAAAGPTTRGGGKRWRRSCTRQWCVETCRQCSGWLQRAPTSKAPTRCVPDGRLRPSATRGGQGIGARVVRGVSEMIAGQGGWMPLHRAARKSGNEAIVRALLDARADPNAKLASDADGIGGDLEHMVSLHGRPGGLGWSASRAIGGREILEQTGTAEAGGGLTARGTNPPGRTDSRRCTLPSRRPRTMRSCGRCSTRARTPTPSLQRASTRPWRFEGW